VQTGFDSDENLATRLGLFDPRHRNAPYGAGCDDSVVRRPAGIAGRPVGGVDRGAHVEAGKSDACRTGQSTIDVNCGDIAFTEVGTEQGCVVAGSGADLQHGLTRMQIEQLEHGDHETRRRRGGGWDATGVARPAVELRRQRLIRISNLQPVRILRGGQTQLTRRRIRMKESRQKDTPWSRRERRSPPRRPQHQ